MNNYVLILAKDNVYPSWIPISALVQSMAEDNDLIFLIMEEGDDEPTPEDLLWVEGSLHRGLC